MPASLSPITAQFLTLPGIRHGFFTRQGGASHGIYASLNCGLGSGDEPTHVVENRARVAAHLGAAPSHLITLYQIHSREVVTASVPWAREATPQADAIVTRTPGLAIGAMAADCAPVLFADPEARVIGAAHAGWRGALSGILADTVDAMEGLGASRSCIRACLGPCISAAAYEVGPEFEAEFLAQSPENARFFSRTAASTRPRFDLPAFVLARLGATGIGSVESQTVCTYADESRFFSFRRTTHRKEPDYGRQISAIVLN